LDDNVTSVIRFLHIISGITWIGLLYYFNVVQTPSFPKMETPARQNAFEVLVPRALLWFRWAAVSTVSWGLLWIIVSAFSPGYLESARFKSIVVGGILGLIMLFNVWAIIWPNQRKIIAATVATLRQQVPAPPEQAGWARRALLASRTNVMLSIPMLFFMVASGHLTSLWTK
jgi:uncharacterized membrane protein